MQDEWIAEWEREQNTCKFHNGPASECGDDQRDWFPQRHICWPTAQLQAAKRLYELQHQEKPYHDGLETIWNKEPSRLTPFHFSDGVTLYLAETDERPDDQFLGGEGPDLLSEMA